MNVSRDWHAFDDRRGRPVITIGVFDGVHRGHRELLRNVRDRADRTGSPCVIVTFDPNPVEVVGRGDPPARLTTMDHRVRLFADLGITDVLILAFDDEMARWSPEHFVREIVVDGLAAQRVVVGQNFRFGYRAAGDVAQLDVVGRRAGFNVDIEPILHAPSEPDPAEAAIRHSVGHTDFAVSSTRIRELIAAGDVAAATRLLVRPHRVEGSVTTGDQRGRTLGYPTANLDTETLAAIPADGVYAGRMIVDPYGSEPETYSAGISVGTNPTFDGTRRRVEAYALDAPDGFEIYDRHVAVEFIDRVRDQVRFDDESALVEQMDDDNARVRAIVG